MAHRMPPPVQRFIRRQYYPRFVRTYPEDRWPFASLARLLVSKGDRVVDIGANIGHLSYLFSRWVGPEGRVYSAEPVPETFSYLKHNISSLGATNVQLFNFAVSNEGGQAWITIPKDAGGQENFYKSRLLEEATQDARRFQITKRRLDDLVTERVSFVKIDVEGHELEVIEGGEKLLAASRPALLIEVRGDPTQADSKAARLFGRLTALGYTVFTYRDQRLRPWQPGETPGDYAFLQPGHMKRVEHLLAP